jgi:hypothetical protein
MLDDTIAKRQPYGIWVNKTEARLEYLHLVENPEDR